MATGDRRRLFLFQKPEKRSVLQFVALGAFRSVNLSKAESRKLVQVFEELNSATPLSTIQAALREYADE